MNFSNTGAIGQCETLAWSSNSIFSSKCAKPTLKKQPKWETWTVLSEKLHKTSKETCKSVLTGIHSRTSGDIKGWLKVKKEFPFHLGWPHPPRAPGDCQTMPALLLVLGCSLDSGTIFKLFIHLRNNNCSIKGVGLFFLIQRNKSLRENYALCGNACL